jgi:hypothetical protein
VPKHKYIVKVPRPHVPRYEPDRPITDLVRNQLLHLSLAQRCLPKHHRAPTDVYSIKTEAEAAEYIRHITAKLHLHGHRSAKSSKKMKQRRSKATNKSRATQQKRKNRS